MVLFIMQMCVNSLQKPPLISYNLSNKERSAKSVISDINGNTVVEAKMLIPLQSISIRIFKPIIETPTSCERIIAVLAAIGGQITF